MLILLISNNIRFCNENSADYLIADYMKGNQAEKAH